MNKGKATIKKQNKWLGSESLSLEIFRDKERNLVRL